MTKKTVEMLKEVLVARRKDAEEQIKSNKKTIKETIEGIIGMDNVKVVRIGTIYKGWSLDVAVVDADGEEVFGTNLDLYYTEDEDEDNCVEVNYGCCGSFGKDDQSQIDKVTMIAKVVQSFDELELMFKGLNTDKVEAYHEADWEVQSAERELQKQYEENVTSKLAEGNEYEYEGGKRTITKLTPKYVTYTDRFGNVEREKKSDFVRTVARDLLRQE